MTDVDNTIVEEEEVVVEQPAQPDPDPELVRVVVVDSCGPSPARCLYTARLVYNVPLDEAAWLFENHHAYREGDTSILPRAERLAIERRAQEERELAEREAKAQAVIARRRERRLARERAVDAAQALRRQKELEALAAKREAEAEAARQEAARLAAQDGGE